MQFFENWATIFLWNYHYTYFLAEDVKPFHLICKLLFYYEEYFNVVVKKFEHFAKKFENQNFANVIAISMQRMLSASTLFCHQ